MNFEFKVFRISNALALTLSGMSAVLSLFALSAAGMSLEIIVSVLAFGACFIHSILSMSLQRTWVIPDVPLKESTPGGIRIMGGIELIFAFFCIFIGFFILLMPNDLLKQAFDQLPEQQRTSNVLTPGYLKQLAGYTLFIGILYALNVILSLRLLKKVVRRQEQEFHKEQE
ncbi:hypothetical protein SAMN05660909_02802 [Chitinophaga terrae (ex Kim and Jung 2007)]|jgi:hypothetical protein|uniref:Uncharacterized protein n=1 Tax=Chitinophaga terrae (ex Kim and Jung 2007) TaxID=408074 RepID=A0A1H4CTV7_9BACT|nr:hypothetical protein [Chitinophaga terrae (ex Kim and Jung 2007)]GEP90467.1 hypothetical protein CTE07_21120 [Chitinophaga terrae (ex Kim and Jung 2007)]SEA63816.1 hypothetical protein SAMN05660909_02802 [Chitinophaga terrae (ex Kim and Jung 2007)]